MKLLLPLTLILGLTACGSPRVTIDFVDGGSALTKSVVIKDASADGDIALIDVTGLIADLRRTGLLSSGENPVDRFIESLRLAETDDTIRGIIVRINSPGGTVTASDVMYRELLAFKQRSKKPAVILMADLAASGGYYLACAGDEIIAHPTTITGSVGVIVQTINISEGLGKIGIKADAITSGPNKAMGSPLEPMKADHRALLQDLVNDFYKGFRGVVTDSRPAIAALPAAEADKILDGRVFTGTRALEVGLVDTLGDIHTAFDHAKHRANLTSARLVKFHRPDAHVTTPYAQSPTPTPSAQFNMIQVNLDALSLLDQPGFWYLWDASHLP